MDTKLLEDIAYTSNSSNLLISIMLKLNFSFFSEHNKLDSFDIVNSEKESVISLFKMQTPESQFSDFERINQG